MRVWVIRHAEAVHAAGRHDHERPLSATGRSQAARLGNYLARRSSATLIISSPIVRARQTAESIRVSMPAIMLETSDALSTSGSAREAIEAICTVRVQECIVVSHEPLTSQMVARLAAGDGIIHVHFTPATAVLLDLGGPSHAGQAQLVECVSPETLQHASEC